MITRLNTNRFFSFNGKKVSNNNTNNNHFINKQTGEDVFLKKGKAWDKNGKPYSGTVLCGDKNDNDIEFDYFEGKIQESRKNGDVLKKYYYPEDIGGIHLFADDSYMDEKEFFGFQNPETTVVFDGTSTTTINKYRNPKYKYEPILDISKVENGSIVSNKRLVKKTGEEKFEFKSLDEANSYFMENYQIETEFDSIAQAHIIKEAIDDFMKLGIDKNAFAGLIITSDESKDPTLYYEGFDCLYDDEEDSDVAHIYEYDDIAIDDEDDDIYNVAIYYDGYDYPGKDTLAEEGFDPENVGNLRKRYTNPILLLSDEFDWSSVESSEASESENYSSYSTIKGNIHHELGHHLHSMSSPYYFAFGRPQTKNEIEIISQVSKYATIDCAEFIAEYIAGRMDGKIYSKEVDDLYKKYGGPDIFKD